MWRDRERAVFCCRTLLSLPCTHHSSVIRVLSSGRRKCSWNRSIEVMLEKIPVITSCGIPASVNLVQNTYKKTKHKHATSFNCLYVHNITKTDTVCKTEEELTMSAHGPNTDTGDSPSLGCLRRGFLQRIP